MTRIIIEKSTVAGIPFLSFAPDDAQQRPLVFFIHGFGQQKESGIELGYRMASAGLFCVAVDAHLHGERLGPPVTETDDPNRATVYPPGTGFDVYFLMHECALQTVRDLGTLIDHFSSDPRVDTYRVGVTGFSMGGYAAYFAAMDPRVTTVVPVGAYPDLNHRWHDLILEAAAYPEWSEAMDDLAAENARRAAWLREIDPAEKMIHGYRKPLLILHGENDNSAPKAYVVPFYGAMRPLYQDHPEQLRLKIYDGVGHQFTAEMMDEAARWFQTYLNKE